MIEVEYLQTITVLKVVGALDAFNRDALKQQVDTLIQQGHSRIAIDLAQVRYLDSSGVAVLLRAWTTARGCGRQLGIIQPSSHARRVLAILRMEFLLFPEPCSGIPADGVAQSDRVDEI